jgi:hypothetical protein
LIGRTLPGIIALLAIIDGVLHLSLDWVLFRGNVIGRLGPPPGVAPPPGANQPPSLPLPLNQLFLLNFLAYVTLALIFWFARERLGSWSALFELALLVVAGLSIAGWLQLRRPNPMNLGYLAKSVEVVLIVLVVTHLWMRFTQRGRLAARPAAEVT